MKAEAPEAPHRLVNADTAAGEAIAANLALARLVATCQRAGAAAQGESWSALRDSPEALADADRLCVVGRGTGQSIAGEAGGPLVVLGSRGPAQAGPLTRPHEGLEPDRPRPPAKVPQTH